MNAATLSRQCSAWLLTLLALIVCQDLVHADDFYRSRWALLIGVGKFASPQIASLKYCRDDVSAVRDLLVTRLGFPSDHVVSLLDEDATKEAIISEFRRLSDRESVAPDDSVLVYFSGQGQTVPLPRGGEMGFLLPYDAAVDLADTSDPAVYCSTCLGMDELRRLSELIPANRVLFLADACVSAAAAETRRDVTPQHGLSAVSSDAASPVRQLIVAGLSDEGSADTGKSAVSPFTSALLRGLGTGAADLDGDGTTTSRELAAFIRSAVPRLAPQTPQYASFGADGDYLFATSHLGQGTPHTSVGPRIEFTAPSGLAEGGAVLAVPAVGDTVTLKCLVLDSEPVRSLSIGGEEVPLLSAGTEGTALLSSPAEQNAARFEVEVKVGPGETKSITFAARDAAGRLASRRILLRAEAADTLPPDVILAELRVRDPEEHEVRWKGLTVAYRAKALTVASKGTATAAETTMVLPQADESLSLAGFARDDRAVVSVEIMGRAAVTRPATPSELEGLGWTVGVAFEGVVAPILPSTEVTVVVSDAAGNRTTESVSVQPESRAGPEILILEPPLTPSARSAGVALAQDTGTLRIAGLARSGSPVVKVSVEGRPTPTRPATDEELQRAGWRPPAAYFGFEAPVPATGRTEGLMVEVSDEEGESSSVVVLVRSLGQPLRVGFSPDRESYRVGDRAHLVLASDRDAYIYLFSLQPDGALLPLLPNPVEPDGLLRGNSPRTFPKPSEEARWGSGYAPLPPSPAGVRTAYCLALPYPLPPAQARLLTDFGTIAQSIAAVGRRRGSAFTLRQSPSEEDVVRLAEDLGGSWRRLEYKVGE